VWILIAAFVVASAPMRYTPTGRRIYATGGNDKAAGVRTLRMTVGLFVFGGMTAAVAGVLYGPPAPATPADHRL